MLFADVVILENVLISFRVYTMYILSPQIHTLSAAFDYYD